MGPPGARASPFVQYAVCRLAYLDDLRIWSLGLAGVGIVVAAAAVERTAAVKAGSTAPRSTTPSARATAAPTGSPRICFASMQDARAAAERAALPAGAVVKVRSDGRVCVR